MGMHQRLVWVLFMVVSIVAVAANGCSDSPSFTDDGPLGGGGEASGGEGGTMATGGGGSGGLSAEDCSENGDACPEQCDADLGCVECLEDAHCTDGDKPKCVAGTCEECASNADCGALVCFLESHTCEDACVDGDDCSGDAPICDPSTTACVQCLDADDCPDDPVCSAITGQCVECAVDADCPLARPQCDGDNRCRECIVDAHCDAGELCQNNECAVPCQDNTGCPDPDKPLCDVADQTCVECLSETDCGGQTPACGKDNECVECADDDDCPGGNAPLCEPDEEICVECVADGDCNDPDNGVCDENQCVECANDNDCPIDAPNCEDNECTD